MLLAGTIFYRRFLGTWQLKDLSIGWNDSIGIVLELVRSMH